jgi:biopolymer transport protein ExbB
MPAACGGEAGVYNCPPMLKPNRNDLPGLRRWRLPPWLVPALLLLCSLAPMLGRLEAQVATSQPAPAREARERTLLDWYWAGGVFMHPIALCSVIALAIIVERLITLRRGNTAPSGFLPGLKMTMSDLNAGRDAGLAYCRGQDHALARVIAAGIRRAPRGLGAMEDAMEDQGASETVKLRRNLRVLYAIASVSTLLGLIGTIQGMIFAFREAEAVGTGKFAPLAKGIYVALVTTFAGLLVAIPVTVAYYFLVGRVERVVSRINDEAGEFLEHYTGGAPAPPQHR